MLNIAIVGFLALVSVFVVDVAHDMTVAPSPSPKVMGVQAKPSPSPTTTPKPVAKQPTTTPKITCTGPDGVRFQTTQKECDEFNAAWGKKAPGSTTYVPSSNQYSQQNTGLVDCSYINNGYILYDYGKVSQQKCNDLSNDWWKRKEMENKTATSKMCLDNALHNTQMCTSDCKLSNWPEDGGTYDGYSACYDKCDSTYQSALAECRRSGGY